MEPGCEEPEMYMKAKELRLFSGIVYFHFSCWITNITNLVA